jgi:hypothetical protein
MPPRRISAPRAGPCLSLTLHMEQLHVPGVGNHNSLRGPRKLDPIAHRWHTVIGAPCQHFSGESEVGTYRALISHWARKVGFAEFHFP